MDVLELKSRIATRIFDYQRLKTAISDQANERRYIGSLMSKGYLIRVKKGLYLWSKKLDSTLYSRETLANLIYGPSYVSLEYALAFYGLIPERVEVVTSITAKKKKEFSTPVGNFVYEYLHGDSFSHGLRLQIYNKEQSFMLATPEKALLDTIAVRVTKDDLQGNVRDFLEQDLRIDWDEFLKLNQDSLDAWGQHYKAQSVKEFLRLLKKERK